MSVLLVPADRGIAVAGTGMALGEREISNAEIMARNPELTDIERLTGIRTRRWVAPETATSDLAVRAAEQALIGVDRAAIARLVLGTSSPDRPVPSTACAVQHRLGLTAAAMDVSAACSGFLYALDAGARAILTGDPGALVIGADVRSRFVDPADRATAALFGDGAGAAVLLPGPPGRGLRGVALYADGSGAEKVYIPAGGSREPATEQTVAAGRHTLRMLDGPQVYVSGVDGMIEAGRRLLSALDLTLADVDRVVPHQPNRRMLERFSRLSGVPMGRIEVNVDRYGNMSAASVAVALHEAWARVPEGGRILLVTAGAGYTAAAALIVR